MDVQTRPIITNHKDAMSWWMRYMEVCNAAAVEEKRLTPSEMREVVCSVLDNPSDVSKARKVQIWDGLKAKGWNDEMILKLREMGGNIKKGMRIIVPYVIEVDYE